MRHLTAEATVPDGRENEAALAEGGIGVRVAVPAQGDQPVEVEVRASLGALGDLVHIEAGPATASLKAKRARARTWAPLGAHPPGRVDGSYALQAASSIPNRATRET